MCICAVHTCCVYVYMCCVLCVHVGLYRRILHMQVPICIHVCYMCAHVCMYICILPSFYCRCVFLAGGADETQRRCRRSDAGEPAGDPALPAPANQHSCPAPPPPGLRQSCPLGPQSGRSEKLPRAVEMHCLFVKFPKVTLPRMVYRLTALGSPLTLLSSRELCFLFIITQNSKEPRQNPASWHLHNPRGKIEQSEVPGLR